MPGSNRLCSAEVVGFGWCLHLGVFAVAVGFVAGLVAVAGFDLMAYLECYLHLVAELPVQLSAVSLRGAVLPALRGLSFRGLFPRAARCPQLHPVPLG